MVMKSTTLVFIFIAVLVLSGCGGDDSDPIEETVTIDFSPPTLPKGSRCENEPFVRNNYLFTPIDFCSYAINNSDGTDNTYLSTDYNSTGSTLTALDNSNFTVYQLDLAEYSTFFAFPQNKELICIKNGTPVYVDILLDGIITDSNDMFETFSLASQCSDISELQFDSGLSIDNIVLSNKK